MKRRRFSADFKTKVVLESLKEYCSVKELAGKHGLHPQQISNWKKEFVKNANQVFSTSNKGNKSDEEKERDKLLRIIGELKVENDFLKKRLP
jgi:transposase